MMLTVVVSDVFVENLKIQKVLPKHVCIGIILHCHLECMILTLDDELLTDGMKELSPRMQRSRCALITACFIACSQMGQLTSDSSKCRYESLETPLDCVALTC